MIEIRIPVSTSTLFRLAWINVVLVFYLDIHVVVIVYLDVHHVIILRLNNRVVGTLGEFNASTSPFSALLLTLPFIVVGRTSSAHLLLDPATLSLQYGLHISYSRSEEHTSEL